MVPPHFTEEDTDLAGVGSVGRIARDHPDRSGREEIGSRATSFVFPFLHSCRFESMCPDYKGHTGMLRPNSCPGAHGLGQGREKTGPLPAELGCKVCSPGLAVGRSGKYMDCSGTRILERLGWGGCQGTRGAWNTREEENEHLGQGDLSKQVLQTGWGMAWGQRGQMTGQWL